MEGGIVAYYKGFQPWSGIFKGFDCFSTEATWNVIFKGFDCFSTEAKWNVIFKGFGCFSLLLQNN